MVATRHVSVDEFVKMPLEGIWELIDGEMIELSPTAGRSGWISATIIALLARYVRTTGVGWAFSSETGFILFQDRQTVRSPDAAVVLQSRLAELPDGFVSIAPDLAVEVLSPSDRMVDALGKVTMYLQAGVRIVWLVDPETSTITVFHPDAAPKMLNVSDTLDGGHVLPGFSVPVAELFS